MQRGDDAKKTIVMKLSEEDFDCPITQETLLNPVMSIHCGHVFDEESIMTWLEKKDTCVCCRAEIEKIDICNIPKLFHEELEAFKSGQAEFKMSVEDFTCPMTKQVFFKPAMSTPCGHMFEHAAIEKWAQTNDECPCAGCGKRIEGIISFLPTLLNEQRKAFLDTYPEFNQRLNLKFLEMLLETEMEGYEKKLKQTIETLITSQDKTLEGIPLILILAKWPKGREFLQDPKILSAVSKDLNTIVLEGEDIGASALFYLAASPEGRDLLQDAEFRKQITAEGLNEIIQAGDFRGYSPVLGLVTNAKGRAILKEDERLRGLINREVLEAQTESGLSAASALQRTAEGKELLALIESELAKKTESKVSDKGLFSMKDSPGKSEKPTRKRTLSK